MGVTLSRITRPAASHKLPRCVHTHITEINIFSLPRCRAGQACPGPHTTHSTFHILTHSHRRRPEHPSTIYISPHPSPCTQLVPTTSAPILFAPTPNPHTHPQTRNPHRRQNGRLHRPPPLAPPLAPHSSAPAALLPAAQASAHLRASAALPRVALDALDALAVFVRRRRHCRPARRAPPVRRRGRRPRSHRAPYRRACRWPQGFPRPVWLRRRTRKTREMRRVALGACRGEEGRDACCCQGG